MMFSQRCRMLQLVCGVVLAGCTNTNTVEIKLPPPSMATDYHVSVTKHDDKTSIDFPTEPLPEAATSKEPLPPEILTTLCPRYKMPDLGATPMLTEAELTAVVRDKDQTIQLLSNHIHAVHTFVAQARARLAKSYRDYSKLCQK